MFLHSLLALLLLTKAFANESQKDAVFNVNHNSSNFSSNFIFYNGENKSAGEKTVTEKSATGLIQKIKEGAENVNSIATEQPPYAIFDLKHASISSSTFLHSGTVNVHNHPNSPPIVKVEPENKTERSKEKSQEALQRVSNKFQVKLSLTAKWASIVPIL